MTIIDQSRVDAQGNVQYTVAGRAFSLPLLHETLAASEPVIRFAAARDEVDALAAFTSATMSDATLSDIGRAQKLDPRREQVLKFVAGHVAALDAFEASINAREARLLAVPVLRDEAAAVAVVDRELRDWWRSQSVAERAEIMRRMNEEPGHERLAIALLRSPYQQLDLEIRSVRETWNRAKRLENPGEANAIDQGRVVTEWSRRAFSHIAGIATTVSRYPRERVLSVLLADESTARAVSAFGFQREFVEQVERQLKGKARQAV